MKKLYILLVVSLMACTKPPKEGCLDQRADNYNKKSEVNCCCSYSANVHFIADTLVCTGDYAYKLNSNWVDSCVKIKMGNIDPKWIPYQILHKVDTVLMVVKEGNVKVYPSKTSYVRF
jgi:hypothetical protein